MSNLRQKIEMRVSAISIDESDLNELSELVEGQLEEIAGGFSSHGEFSRHGESSPIIREIV